MASFFGKTHDNVLKAADKALREAGPGGVVNFNETRYAHPQNGQLYRMFEMTKDGFVFLTMGFTGAKAATFKRAYVKEFNRMEADRLIIEHRKAKAKLENKLVRASASSGASCFSCHAGGYMPSNIKVR